MAVLLLTYHIDLHYEVNDGGEWGALESALFVALIAEDNQIRYLTVSAI
jgi:hypothetical protein